MNAPDKLKLSTFTTYSELKINRRKTSGVSPELNSTCLRNYREKKKQKKTLKQPYQKNERNKMNQCGTLTWSYQT